MLVDTSTFYPHISKIIEIRAHWLFWCVHISSLLHPPHPRTGDETSQSCSFVWPFPAIVWWWYGFLSKLKAKSGEYWFHVLFVDLFRHINTHYLFVFAKISLLVADMYSEWLPGVSLWVAGISFPDNLAMVLVFPIPLFPTKRILYLTSSALMLDGKTGLSKIPVQREIYI